MNGQVTETLQAYKMGIFHVNLEELNKNLYIEHVAKMPHKELMHHTYIHIYGVLYKLLYD